MLFAINKTESQGDRCCKPLSIIQIICVLCSLHESSDCTPLEIGVLKKQKVSRNHQPINIIQQQKWLQVNYIIFSYDNDNYPVGGSLHQSSEFMSLLNCPMGDS